MPQPVAQIPGFYYDTEKQKYFRVLPHHAAPTAAFYSSSSVQRAEREKQRADELRTEAAQQLERKRRSPLKTNVYVKSTLFRELGATTTTPEHTENRRRVYTRGLRRHRVFEVDPGRKITAVATDTASVVIGTSAGDVRILPLSPHRDEPTVDTSAICPLIHSYSQVTSISISSQRCLLATFMGERQSPIIYLTQLSDPSTPHHAPGLQHIFARPIRAIWTSSASPSGNNLLLGTSASAVHIIPHPHTLHKTEFRIKSDVFATSFLPSEHHPFLCGSRDGDVRLFDIRTPPSRPEILIRHGGTVTHIRPLSGNSIIVNGLNRCANYDLRYPHPKSPSSGFARATRAARVYHAVTREKEFMIGRGFDVDKDRGVIAAADHEHRVDLFSAATGERLQSVLGERKWEVPCTGLAFDGATEPGRVWGVEGMRLMCFAY